MPEVKKISNSTQPQNKTQTVPMARPLSNASYAEELTKRFTKTPLDDFVKIYKKEPDITDNVKTKEDVVNVTKLSHSYLNKLIEFEGLSLKEYKDAAGIKTIGFGHNIEADSTYNYGSKITEEQAYRILAKDLLIAKEKLKKMTNGKFFTQNQHEALVDIFFNVKTKTIEKSDFLKHLIEGNNEKAVQEMDFIRTGNKINIGLCIRRIEDINIFCGQKHTFQSILSIKNIIKNGTEMLDNKIKKTSFKKLLYWSRKYTFEHKAQELLNAAEKTLDEK